MESKELVALETQPAEKVIEWALTKFGTKVALASSFGAEDVVLIDLMVKVADKINLPRKEIHIFTLDTGRLPEETYKVMDEIQKKYNIKYDVYFPDTVTMEKMLRENRMNLFYDSIEFRRLCCNLRKVEPLNRALNKLDAWLCGLRREQAVTRVAVQKVELDSAHNNILKINPLAEWTEKQVWDYIKQNKVPYNELHDKGFPSIGCAPCTRAVKPGEDVRAGRWWWESPDKKECGLHTHK